MAGFLKVKDTSGNFVFVNPDHVTCVTQRERLVDIVLVTGGTITIEAQADSIVSQLESRQR
jgi:hypothetical protein